MARERLEGGAHVHEQLGVGVRHRRDLGRRAPGLLEQVAQLGVGVRQRGHHRLEVVEERVQRADHLVDVLAAARQRGAVAVEHRAQVGPELVVLDVEEVVELGGLERLLQRDRVAGREGLRAAAGRERDVLQAQRRARADLQARVGRQRLDLLVELERHHRDRLLLVALGHVRRALVRRWPCRAGSGPPRPPGSRPGAPRCPPPGSSRRGSPPSRRRSARTAARCSRCRRGRPRSSPRARSRRPPARGWRPARMSCGGGSWREEVVEELVGVRAALRAALERQRACPSAASCRACRAAP